MAAAARTNSPRPQFMQRCSVTVAQIRLQNGLHDAIYTNNLPTRAAAEVRPHFLPFAARSYSARSAPSIPACAPRASLCLHVHSARSALFADLVNLGLPVAFSLPPGRVYTARCPANQHCAVSPRCKGLPVRDDPCPPALAVPNRSSIPSVRRRSHHQRCSSALSLGAACRTHAWIKTRWRSPPPTSSRPPFRAARRARSRPCPEGGGSPRPTAPAPLCPCAAGSVRSASRRSGRHDWEHRQPAGYRFVTGDWHGARGSLRRMSPHLRGTATLAIVAVILHAPPELCRRHVRVLPLPDHATHIPQPFAPLVGIRRSLCKPEQGRAKCGCRRSRLQAPRYINWAQRNGCLNSSR